MEYSLLISHIESKSEERIRYALQKLFWSATRYSYIPRHHVPYSKLEEFIEHKSDKIRLWAYYVTCHYCNNNILEITKKNILTEKNLLIRSWMLATIKNYEFNSFNLMIRKDLGLPEATVEFIKHFFREKRYETIENKVFLDKVMGSDNMLDKRWLTMFYKYKPYMLKQEKGVIPIEYITDLTYLCGTNDEFNVAESALSGLYSFSPMFSFKEHVSFQIQNIEKICPDQQKWAYTLIWKDQSLINNNIDFVREIMFAKKINSKNREGLAKGLLENGTFQKELEDDIIEWYLKETDYIINSEYLWTYMQNNKSFSEKFRRQVEGGNRKIIDKISMKDRGVNNSNNKNQDYHVAISFAEEDREIAENIACRMKSKGYYIFSDKYEQADFWGKDLYSHLTEIYTKKAKYCLMIISENYAEKQWTNLERRAAQARAFSQSKEYILPLKLDDTEIPGLVDTIGYVDYREVGLDEIINMLEFKLNE